MFRYSTGIGKHIKGISMSTCTDPNGMSRRTHAVFFASAQRNDIHETCAHMKEDEVKVEKRQCLRWIDYKGLEAA